MSKFLVEYKISTPISTETFHTSISSPNANLIEEFIASRMRTRKLQGQINVTSIKDLSEEVWKEMYVKELGEKYQNI